jgi:hypothetical protein
VIHLNDRNGNGVNKASKLIVAISGLAVAVAGLVAAFGNLGSDSPQAPAVIVIRGSTLADTMDDLTDSERDREYFMEYGDG